jgi:hypothetical protein
MIQGSLGSDGVQISLLADYGNLDKDKESSHRRRRLVCLDVLAVSTLFRSQVFLLLDPENEHDFADGFIPYGLGKFRRFVSSDPMSDYMMSNALPHEEFTFKRTKITVSQLITTTCKPGNSKRFNFQLLGLPPLADDIICLGEKDTVVTLPSDTKYYECRGGILKVQHPCSRCNEDRVVLIMFGSREGNLSPWCYISKCPTKESSKSNIMVIYKEMEQRNAGLYQEAGWYLEKCHQRLSVVLSSAKDGNSYDISISCKGDSLVPFA